MTNLTPLCITLAEKLGWETEPHLVTIIPDIYEFIAHAKAELAKRGWIWHWDSDEFVELSDGTSDFAFIHDPTNPLSTAEAELKAMIEAVS